MCAGDFIRCVFCLCWILLDCVRVCVSIPSINFIFSPIISRKRELIKSAISADKVIDVLQKPRHSCNAAPAHRPFTARSFIHRCCAQTVECARTSRRTHARSRKKTTTWKTINSKHNLNSSAHTARPRPPDRTHAKSLLSISTHMHFCVCECVAGVPWKCLHLAISAFSAFQLNTSAHACRALCRYKYYMAFVFE